MISKTSLGASASCLKSLSPKTEPIEFATSSGMSHRPALTKPTLRPDAPKPISFASRTTDDLPAPARCSAAEQPVKPPPMIATSAVVSPLRASRPSSGGAEICQRPWVRGSEGACVFSLRTPASLSSMPPLGAPDEREAYVASHDQDAAILFQVHFASVHHS